MKKLLLVVFTVFVLLPVNGVCDIAQKTETLLISSQSASPTDEFGGFDLTIKLPEVASLKTDTSGTPLESVVFLSGRLAGFTSIEYDSVPKTLSISFVSSISYQPGELATVIMDVPIAYAPNVSDVSIIKSVYHAALTGEDLSSIKSNVAFSGWELLTVQTAGSGSGSLNSTPSGITCVTGSSQGCSALFPTGEKVTITQTPSYSTFDGWTGHCSGSGTCSVTMDANKSVTASFSADPATVKISDSATRYYAIDPVLNLITVAGKSVSARDIAFTENVVMNSPVTIKLLGGYTDNLFTDRTATSITVIDGSLKVRNGALKVDRVKVR